jgi:hypothetical protein
MKCPGLHCKGCGDHGGGAFVVLVVIALALAAALDRPIDRAASAVLRVVVNVVEIAAIALVSLAGLCLVAGGVLVGARVRRFVLARRRRADHLGPAPAVYVVRPEAVRELPVSQPRRPADLPYRPRTVPAITPARRPGPSSPRPGQRRARHTWRQR